MIPISTWVRHRRNPLISESTLALMVFSALVVFTLAVCASAPTADEIATRVTDKLNDARSLQADLQVEIREAPNKEPTRFTVRAASDRASKLTRMEVMQHPVLEGQIMIFDLQRDQATVFMPVTGQAFRGKPNVIGAQLGVDMRSLDPDHLLSLDPKKVLAIKYLRQERLDRIPHYVLETRAQEQPDMYQLVWVDCETYLIKQIEVYDSQRQKILSVVVRDLRLNIRLDPNKLRELPRGTRVIDLK